MFHAFSILITSINFYVDDLLLRVSSKQIYVYCSLFWHKIAVCWILIAFAWISIGGLFNYWNFFLWSKFVLNIKKDMVFIQVSVSPDSLGLTLKVFSDPSSSTIDQVDCLRMYGLDKTNQKLLQHWTTES